MVISLLIYKGHHSVWNCACWFTCRSYSTLPQKAYFWQTVAEVPLDVKYYIMSVDANSRTGT